MSTLKIATFVLIENYSYPIRISEVVFYANSITLLSKGKIMSALSLDIAFQTISWRPEMDVCQHALNNFGTSIKSYKETRK